MRLSRPNGKSGIVFQCFRLHFIGQYFRIPFRQQIWLQNFFPPQVDLNGNAPAQQLILGGQGDASAAAQIRERAAAQWRAQKPDELKNWSNFQPGS